MLTVKEVSLHFGGVKALNSVSFHVKKGEIAGLIGPNGAGKTSLFNVISGIYLPTEGIITFNDQQLSDMRLYKINRSGVSRTFQNIMVFPDLTVIENVLIGRQSRTKAKLWQVLLNTKFTKQEREQALLKAESLLDAVGLTTKCNELAGNLPYGEQRKLDIARALATDPEILLLDEPAAGLNLQERISLRALITNLNQMGYTIILIEHDIKLVMGLCQHIMVLDYGHKIADGTPKEVQRNQAVIQAYLGKQG